MSTGTSSVGVFLMAVASALAAPGDIDPTFSPAPDGTVYSLAAQGDGRTVVGGSFSTISGASHPKIARLNSDGTLDTSFNLGVNRGYVSSVTVQSDGRILIAGNFTNISGAGRKYVARLHLSGSLDTSFDPGTGPAGYVYGGYVTALATQADGRVLVGGYFTNVAGVARNYIARLNGDGSLDTAFNNGSGPNGQVSTLAVQDDGRILIGGKFASVNGVARYNIARLNSDGSLDMTFTPDSGYSELNCLIGYSGNLVAGRGQEVKELLE